VLSPREAAIEAAREIGLAVLATTLSLVAVFLPWRSWTGSWGASSRPSASRCRSRYSCRCSWPSR
jgi:multidrug efflux pump subunit AcrB